VASSLNPSTFGQPVTFTATVAGNYASPTGPVTFMDGTTTLGTATLTPTGPTVYTPTTVTAPPSSATFTISTLAVGTHPITAVYGATEYFDASNSTVLSQVVNLESPTVSLVSSLNPSNYGQSVTFTATLSGSYAAPTGSVVFMDGSTQIGTATLTSTGAGSLSSTATFTTSTLPAGTDPITVTYAATQNFAAATSAVLSQVVAPIFPTTATLTSSLNPAVAGQSVTFTASVVSTATGSGPPTGAVTFMDGGTVLGTQPLVSGSSSTASTGSFTTSSLASGSHTITATLVSTGGFLPSNATLTETIQPLPADFSISLASPGITIQVQHNVTTSVTLTSLNGFADTLALTCTKPPINSACRFTPTPVALSANSTATASLYIDVDTLLSYAPNGLGPLHRRTSPILVAFLLSPFGLFASIGFYGRRSGRKFRRRIHLLLFLLAGISMPLAFSGCGTTILPIGLAPGTYTIPVVATGASTGISHAAQLILTVTR
jgi:hypothetical protein